MSRKRRRRPGKGAFRGSAGKQVQVQSTPVRRDDLEIRWPDLLRKENAAIQRLLEDEHRTACSHITSRTVTVPGVAVCAHHPAAGLMCMDCVADHATRHDRELEQTCDICGTHDPQIAAIVGVLAAHGLDVYDRHGHGGLIVGEIYLNGLGLCRSCKDKKAA